MTIYEVMVKSQVLFDITSDVLSLLLFDVYNQFILYIYIRDIYLRINFEFQYLYEWVIPQCLIF